MQLLLLEATFAHNKLHCRRHIVALALQSELKPIGKRLIERLVCCCLRQNHTDIGANRGGTSLDCADCCMGNGGRGYDRNGQCTGSSRNGFEECSPRDRSESSVIANSYVQVRCAKKRDTKNQLQASLRPRSLSLLVWNTEILVIITIRVHVIDQILTWAIGH